jgi:hypothetical protein
MLLITHIVIALLGVLEATLAAVRPSDAKLKTVGILLAGTITTGTYLVWSTHSNILSSCLSGLCYIGVVGVLSAVARYRLAYQTAHSRRGHL